MTSSYVASGVDIDAGNRAVALMRNAVKSTYGPEVLAGIGSFGGLFDASALKAMNDPVLVASTDGVGTKVKLAAQAGRYESIGHDIVNHCIDDILVQGARPLFFLDYIASSKLDPEMVAAVVTGMAAACRESGCALLGGETAEMPGVYQPGEFDVAGTIVGLVDRAQILPRTSELRAGDVLIGLRSSGPHTNGYSLIRKIFQESRSILTMKNSIQRWPTPYSFLIAPICRLLTTNDQGLAANYRNQSARPLTGGGFIENIPRILPDHLDAQIDLGSWPVLPIFQLIQQQGEIDAEEMYRVFNMGIGMIAIVAPEDVSAVQAAIPEETYVIGQLDSRRKESCPVVNRAISNQQSAIKNRRLDFRERLQPASHPRCVRVRRTRRASGRGDLQQARCLRPRTRAASQRSCDRQAEVQGTRSPCLRCRIGGTRSSLSAQLDRVGRLDARVVVGVSRSVSQPRREFASRPARHVPWHSCDRAGVCSLSGRRDHADRRNGASRAR